VKISTITQLSSFDGVGLVFSCRYSVEQSAFSAEHHMHSSAACYFHTEVDNILNDPSTK